jgi:hypothetical protein
LKLEYLNKRQLNIYYSHHDDLWRILTCQAGLDDEEEYDLVKLLDYFVTLLIYFNLMQ